MGLKEDVASDVDGVLSQPWKDRDGTVVPDTEDVALAGGGVHLNATILYADLADSTELVMEHDRRVAAKVMKCFLASCTRIIKEFGGDIRSFDGDRVMGIYVDGTKNTSAAKTALKIAWAFRHIVKPKIEAHYATVKNGSFKLDYSTGVDTSTVLAVRGGVRGSNDLLWVGRAPNVAAKLSNLRQAPYQSWITHDVYKMLKDESKYTTVGGVKKDMWEPRTFTTVGGMRIYRSLYEWSL